MSDTLHKMSMDEFRRQREEVLASWPTGKDVDFQEAVDYHKSLPDSKVFSKKLEMARKEKITLIQPRAGVPLIDKHIELMQFLEKRAMRTCCLPPSTAIPATICTTTAKRASRNPSPRAKTCSMASRLSTTAWPTAAGSPSRSACRCRSATAPPMPAC